MQTQREWGSNRLYVTTAAKDARLIQHETVKIAGSSRNSLTNGSQRAEPRTGHLQADETEDLMQRRIREHRSVSLDYQVVSQFWGVGTTRKTKWLLLRPGCGKYPKLV